MITKNMTLGEILQTDKAEAIAEVLMAHGMHCFGCPASQMETLEEACEVHGVNCDDLLNKINSTAA